MALERLGSVTVSDVKPAILAPQEGEVRQSIGVALLIVGLDSHRNGDNATDPLMWTIVELQVKLETDKKPGEVSIPAETIKVGESRDANVLGALAEFCDDSAIPNLEANLFSTDGFYRENGIIIKGNPVDLAVLIYDGPLDIHFAPESLTEVSGNGWIKRSIILGMDNVRPVLSKAVKVDQEEGLVSRALDSYYAGSAKRVIPPGFSMTEFYSRREILPDVRIPSLA